MIEQWRPIPGWEGLYEVSDQGRARSLPRQTARGVRGGKILQLNPDGRGYLTIAMSRDSQVTRGWIHQLVLAAFVGPRPEGMEVAHENGDPQDCRLVNLSYKTKSGNMLDAVRHGTHRNARKTECPDCGGPYSVNGRGQRFCPACRNGDGRERYAAGSEAVLVRHREYREQNLERRRQIERESKRRTRAQKKAMQS